MAHLRWLKTDSLSLDGPVNDLLQTWKIPENDFTRATPVTLTHLTSHSGGLTVHGFPGYAVGRPVYRHWSRYWTGSSPANTPAIFVDQMPGESMRYSGGGYTVMQQLMIDVGEAEFPPLMDALVLAPLAMRHSTFAQPLPPALLENAAAGVLPDGTDVAGKRHTYPEMAAAGLWTTAYDLALFAADVQQALEGDGEVLSKAMATAMLEQVATGYGRGFALATRGGHPYFEHGGWDEGFCAQLTASRDAGVGVAVMINSNHPAFLSEVVNAVAATYDWPGYETLEQQPMPKAALTDYIGVYRYNEDMNITVSAEDGRLYMQYRNESPQELLHIGDNVFVRREREARITFTPRDDTVDFEFIIGADARQTHERVSE